MRKRCLCLVLCLLISLLCFPTAVPAEDISGTAVPVAAVDGLGSFATVSEAVDAISSSGGTGTVHLLSDCVLPETLSIPAGLHITLTDDGSGYTVSKAVSSGGFSHGMICIAEDASLQLCGDITIRLSDKTGLYDGYIVSCKGELTLESGTLDGGGCQLNAYRGLVDIRGAKAAFTMNSGSIRNARPGASGGGVRVCEGGSFVINGGEITGMDAGKNYRAGAVLVNAYSKSNGSGGAAEFIMNGGEIHGNNGYRGVGVCIVGEDFQYLAKMTMNGGKIYGNTASSFENTGLFFQSAGAGVYIEFSAELVMNGGEISRNTVYGGMGGGVAAACGYEQAPAGWTIEAYSRYYPAAFTMNGGEIRGNAAYMANGHNGCGGGVYVASDCVELKGGIIADNYAEKQGGGIYIGSTPYVLRMSDALITENRAELLGGGIWLCPTGDAEIFTTKGAGIFGNTSEGSGDDIVSVKNSGAIHMLTLSERMLGGGRVTWMEDGGLDSTEELGLPDGSVPRCGSGSIAVTDVVNSAEPYALKAVPEGDGRALAIASAKLLITGNSSLRGGGIGCNGGVIIGDVQEWSLAVSKSWQDDSGNEASTEYLNYVTPVTVYLMAGDYILDSVELNEENGWQAKFTGLPAPDTLPEEYALSVSENPTPEHFAVTYSDPVTDADANTVYITVINSYSSSGSEPTAPETGDDFPRMVWGMLFAVGTAALTGMAVCGKKKDIDS